MGKRNYVSDAAIDAAASRPTPLEVPRAAYGAEPIAWARHPPPVWAWISWPDRPAERVAAIAKGWNDRVVVVAWWGQPGGERMATVWRSAVRHRVRRP